MPVTASMDVSSGQIFHFLFHFPLRSIRKVVNVMDVGNVEMKPSEILTIHAWNDLRMNKKVEEEQMQWYLKEAKNERRKYNAKLRVRNGN